MVFAYAVWLMHAAAGHRDAGKLADTAPVYGLAQWRREPAVTRRARSLALVHARVPRRRPPSARRAAPRRPGQTRRDPNPVPAQGTRSGAGIAATTLDIDAAAELTAYPA